MLPKIYNAKNGHALMLNSTDNFTGAAGLTMLGLILAGIGVFMMVESRSRKKPEKKEDDSINLIESKDNDGNLVYSVPE